MLSCRAIAIVSNVFVRGDYGTKSAYFNNVYLAIFVGLEVLTAVIIRVLSSGV
jgi:hypothetical protein